MDVVIYGSRSDGHAKVILEVLERIEGLSPVGLIDDIPANRTRSVMGLSVLGDMHELQALANRGIGGVVLGFGDHATRAETCMRVLAARLALPTVVHPDAMVSRRATVADGAQLLARAYAGPDAHIEQGVLINTGAIVEHDVVVGSGAVIGPGAIVAGRARIGAGSMIGAGATVLPDRSVGAGGSVGAGAVVIRDVPEGATVIGVPAEPLGRSR